MLNQLFIRITEWFQSKKFLIAILALVIFCFATILPVGFSKAATMALSVSVMGIAVYQLIGVISPIRMSLRIFCLVYIMQNFWLMLYILTSEDGLVMKSLYQPNLIENPYLATFPSLIPIVCALFFSLMQGVKRVHGISAFDILRRSALPVPAFSYMLILCAALLPIYFVVANGVGQVGFSYILIFMQSTVFGAPFLVGVFYAKYRRTAWICLALFIVSGFFGFAEGSRWYLFIPLALFAVGYFTAQVPRKRASLILIYLILAMPALIFLSYVERVRNVVRTSSESMTERASMMIDLIEREGFDITYTEEALNLGIMRLVSWTNVVTPLLSPDSIGYRGYDDVLDELRFNFQLQVFNPAGRTQMVASDFGVGVASNYGFVVNEDATVPFGLIADAWSRDGAAGVALYSAIFCVCIIVIEEIIKKLFSGNPLTEAIIMMVFLGQVFFRVDASPMFQTVRYLGVSIVFWTILLKLFEFFVPAFNAKRVATLTSTPPTYIPII